MIPYTQVINGVTKYIDSEIVPKFGGFAKIAVGIISASAVKRGDYIMNQIKTIPLIKMIGIIDDENKVDIDIIYQEAKKQLAKEPISIMLPMLGTITFTHSDVDKLYTHITGGEYDENY